MPNKATQDIIDKLSKDISMDTGLDIENEIKDIASGFNKTLSNVLTKYNSSIFDNDGFIKRMQDYDTGIPEDKDTVKNILSGIKQEYSVSRAVNNSEILLKYELNNIKTQMSEMNDVVNIVRDAVVECNVSTGEVSRSIHFDNNEEDDQNKEDQVYEMERRLDLLYGIKNFMVTNTLTNGELPILIKPYAKIFAELEALSDSKQNSFFKESLSNNIKSKYSNGFNLKSSNNMKYISESVEIKKEDKEVIEDILENINIYNNSSILVAEMGLDATREFMIREYKEKYSFNNKDKLNHFNEAINNYNSLNNPYDTDVDEDTIEFDSYNDIKGVYIKYLDPLKIITIRMDRKVIGYYYITTSTTTRNRHPAQPAGVLDTTYQNFTRNKHNVDRLAELIIKSFDKKILAKNINLKSEIVEIVMAHKFNEGKLNFVYIPESEIVRLVINEDENGKGHSILEPSLFNARNYVLLNLYNMLYILNNNTTRIHYLKSSGLDKNYADTVQRAMRKFQSRRISVDDFYSYSGVLNKVGGIGEMVLPTGRNDYKALETDTIPAVEIPINVDFMEQQRKGAIGGSSVPNLMAINSLDEIEFAKSMELANTRFISTVSSYKLDFNKGITTVYQRCMKYETDISDSDIQTFRFAFNTITQPQLVITTDMIQNFNQVFELTSQILFKKSELEDEQGNPTEIAMQLKKELAKEYIPQLDFDILDEIVERVKLSANKDKLKDTVKNIKIEDEDIAELKK